MDLCSFTAQTHQTQQEPPARGGQRGPRMAVCILGLSPTTNCWGRRRNSEHLCNPTKVQKELMITVSYITPEKIWRQAKTTENWNLDRKPTVITFLESLTNWYQSGPTSRWSVIQFACKALHKLQQQTLAPWLQAHPPERNMLEVSIHTVRDLQAAHPGPLCTKVPFKTKCEAASHRKQACRSPPLGREVLVPLSEWSKSLNPQWQKKQMFWDFRLDSSLGRAQWTITHIHVPLAHIFRELEPQSCLRHAWETFIGELLHPILISSELALPLFKCSDCKDVTPNYTCGILNTSTLPSGQDAEIETKGWEHYLFPYLKSFTQSLYLLQNDQLKPN